MMENSAEYKTMLDHTTELRLAVGPELISLSGSLLASRLISLDSDTVLRNMTHSVAERSARLIDLVQNKVRQNPRHYHSFIGILKDNQDQNRDILQRLEHTFQTYQHQDGSSTSDVSKHIYDLENRFRVLHGRILSELEDRRISVPVLLSSLTVLPTKLKPEYKNSICEVFPEIRSEAEIREAFYHLSPLIDFLSCGLLMYIIGEFGSNTLKIMMETYQLDLIRFMKATTVKEVMDVWPSQQDIPPNFSRLRATLDHDPMTYTLYELDQLRRQYCGAIKLTEIVLVLIGLESANSFVAEWIIPSSITSWLLESAKILDIGYYRHEHIIELTLDGKWIFLDVKPKLPAFQKTAIWSKEDVSPMTSQKLGTAATTYTMASKNAKRAPSALDKKDIKPIIYFHIENKQQLKLIEATGAERVTLPVKDEYTYYRTECTYPEDAGGSKLNDDKSICLPHVDETLRNLLAAVKEESSVDGILFQARFGNVFFSFPPWFNMQDMDIVSTDTLQQDKVHKKFSFRFPSSVSSQNFMQKCCDISSVNKSGVRYKVEFKQYLDDGNLIKAGCHIEEKDGTFRHIWTRVHVKIDETDDTGQLYGKVDVVRPGQRQMDMRIITHIQTPCCQPGNATYEISERIRKSMTRNESGDLSMQVVAQDFCVVFIRKKITETYTWIDPSNRNKGWTVTELRANNAPNKEDEYLAKRRKKDYEPVTVEFYDEIKEIDFSGETHATKLTEDPNSTVCTPDEFVADFKAFVEASLYVAELLDDSI